MVRAPRVATALRLNKTPSLVSTARSYVTRNGHPITRIFTGDKLSVNPDRIKRFGSADSVSDALRSPSPVYSAWSSRTRHVPREVLIAGGARRSTR